MKYIPLYIDRKHGRGKVEYQHPIMEEIIKPTYGIMVYQEQIMKVAQEMGGFTLGKADLLRRAMGKKNMEIMEEQKKIFLEGAKEKSIDDETAEKVYEDMKQFAEYGFNRSHSAAYSLIAYQTAYLKAHYPAEYMAAVLTHNLNEVKKINFFIEEAKRHHIPVLGPDINESDLKFVVNDKGEIRFGLAAIKGLGESAAESIVMERENGPYTGVFDFGNRVNSRTVNKRCYEALVKAGAFDSFTKVHRAQYFFQEREDLPNFLEKIVKHASMMQNEMNGGLTLFADEVEVVEPKFPECEPWTKIDQLKFEKEVTGIYISGHPLEDYKIEIDNFCNVEIVTLKEHMNAFRNREIVFQLALFSEDYMKWKHLVEEGEFLLVKARVQQRYNAPEQLEIKIHHLSLLSETINTFAKSITLKISLASLSEELINNVINIVESNKGKSKLNINVFDADPSANIIMLSKKYKVDIGKIVKHLNELESVEYKIN
jgi:DNA polymerase-3 subunit alpha